MRKHYLIITLLILFTGSLGLGCRLSNTSETAQLKKEIEELKKERRKTENNTNNEANLTTAEKSKKWVKMNGGYLNLRNSPDTETGNPIAKIPNGAEIMVGGCQENSVNIGGREGRWCHTTYDGKDGWVFDAWLSADEGSTSIQNANSAAESDSPDQNSTSAYHLSKDDMHRIMMSKGMRDIYGEYFRPPWVEILKVGQFNQQQKYWPVRIRRPINAKKNVIADCRIFKNDYSEWVVRCNG